MHDRLLAPAARRSELYTREQYCRFEILRGWCIASTHTTLAIVHSPGAMKYTGGRGTSNYEYGMNNVPVACTRREQAGTEVLPGHANAKAGVRPLPPSCLSAHARLCHSRASHNSEHNWAKSKCRWLPRTAGVRISRFPSDSAHRRVSTVHGGALPTGLR